MASRNRYIASFTVSGNNVANGTITFSDLGTVYTANITELNNLYYTNARVVSGITTANISNITVSGNIGSGNVLASQYYWANGTVFSSGGVTTGKAIAMSLIFGF